MGASDSTRTTHRDLSPADLAWRTVAGAMAETVHHPMLMLDADLAVVSANRAFCDAFAVTPAEAQGRPVYELDDGRWNTPALHRLLDDMLPRDGAVDGFEVTQRFENGDRRTLLLNARRLDAAALVLLAIKEINERRTEQTLRVALKAARLGAWERDLCTGELTASATCKANLGLPPDAPLTFEMLQAMRHPDDRERVAEAVRRAVAGGTDYDVETRVIWPDGSVHWLILRGHALYDDAGRPVRMIGVTLDITEHKRMEEALKESETRFRTLADSAPVLIWMSGLDKGGVYFNKPWLDFTGRAIEQELGDGWIGSVHPEDLQALEACIEAFAARRPFGTDFRLRRHDGEWRWMLDTGTPRFGPDGTFAGYIGTCVDITERKRAEEQRELLLAELSHRVKNTLATVQSITTHTLADGIDSVAARRALDGRLRALAHTHTLLAEGHWRGAGMTAVVRAELAPFDGRADITGEDLVLRPRAALTLGMAVHELATNAAKYGALSVPQGRVEVAWASGEAGTGGTVLRLMWREVGGPRVRPPERRGFGRTLIERGVAYDLAGVARLEFRRDGLCCELEIPLAEAVAA